jgi:hypothetical protein
MRKDDAIQLRTVNCSAAILTGFNLAGRGEKLQLLNIVHIPIIEQ